jgi:hypothetical protein
MLGRRSPPSPSVPSCHSLTLIWSLQKTQLQSWAVGTHSYSTQQKEVGHRLTPNIP